jgi:hypothetical protein
MLENTNKVEEILNEIKENLEVENKVSSEIAKSADGLIAAQLEKFEVLSKSVDAVSEKLDNILNTISELNIPSQDEIEKAIEVKAEELSKTVEEKDAEHKVEIEELSKKVEDLENEPVVKSATVVVEKVEEEVVETLAPTRDELIKTAMAELPTADYQRKSQLFKAISRLEAGVSIDKINF